MQFSTKKLLFVSIFAGILACIADVLLLYTPDANYENMDYQFLLQIPIERVFWGHYLGIIAIPFELPGLLVLAACFRPLGQRVPYFVASIIIFIIIIGVVYHGSIVFVAQALQASPSPMQQIEVLRPYFDPLGSALASIFLILSCIFAFLVFLKKTTLPRKSLFFNPLLSYSFCILLYMLIPDIGRFFAVAGFNFSITILLISLLLLKVDNAA